MANNVTVTPGVGNSIATDDIGGVHYQVVKLAHGQEDAASMVSAVSGLPVAQAPAQSVFTSSVAATTSSTPLAGDSGGLRRGLTFYNDSPNYLYLRCNAAASTTLFQVRLEPYQYYELPQPIWGGLIYGIWSGSTGAVRVTEFL